MIFLLFNIQSSLTKKNNNNLRYNVIKKYFIKENINL